MFQAIDLITNVLLLALAILVLPSALIGSLSAAIDRQGGLEAAEEPPEHEEPQLPQYSLQPTDRVESVSPMPVPKQMLWPAVSAVDAEIFANNDPLA